MGLREAGALPVRPTVSGQNSERQVKRSLFGGADGIRTHDLLDAIEARSQLRHGPTGEEIRLKPLYHPPSQAVKLASRAVVS